MRRPSGGAAFSSAGALPLADIAATARFADHAHLTHRFHAHYGCPPSEFRRTTRH
ncbi:helix-turn-helix domain-containing protein [Kitasatospora sp. NPDC097605]|uniref:helix-turn-helix domain-containing protein n=1 Tax=Kitasatospora sp. NPDC097605 TaxID=3157226 RepID=UPI003320004E